MKCEDKAIVGTSTSFSRSVALVEVKRSGQDRRSDLLVHCHDVAKEQFAHRETEELLSMLDRVAAKTSSRGQVFDDFLTMTVCALSGGRMEAEYLATIAKYIEGEKGARSINSRKDLGSSFISWRKLAPTSSAISSRAPSGERGQFFTPDPLCTLMAELNTDDGPSLGRTICDTCCGSGRLLLAMSKMKSFARFVGQDLRCVKITAINLALHNLYGYAIWGNSLANERKLAYATGFDGTGVNRKVDDDELRAIAPPPSESLASPDSPLLQHRQYSISSFDEME